MGGFRAEIIKLSIGLGGVWLLILHCCVGAPTPPTLHIGNHQLGYECPVDLKHHRSHNDNDTGLDNLVEVNYQGGVADATSTNNVIGISGAGFLYTNVSNAFGQHDHVDDMWMSAALCNTCNDSLPQAIWMRFPDAIKVVKFSFASHLDNPSFFKHHLVWGGPTKYVFFASNDSDCGGGKLNSVESLLVDDSGSSFTNYSHRKVRTVTNFESYHCYGFVVNEVPNTCDINKTVNPDVSQFAWMSNIRFWTGNWVGCREKMPNESTLWNCSSGFNFGSQCFCANGFKGDNSTCQSDLTWSNQSTPCQRVNCPDWPEATNCTAVFESTCRAPCPATYKTGEMERTCRADGTWSNPIYHCDPITCHKRNLSGLIDIASRNALDWECGIAEQLIGQSCSLKCKADFEAHPQVKAVCGPDGKWKVDNGNCISKRCPQLKNDGHYFWSCSRGHQEGSLCTRYCLPGHFSKFPSVTKLCQTNDTWTSPPMDPCQRVSCGVPRSVANGHWYCTGDHKYGSTPCNLVCDKGYEFENRPQILCGKSGEWHSSVKASCLPVKCPDLETPQRGSWNCTRGEKYDSDCVLDCQKGYATKVSVFTKCGADAKWTDYSGECRKEKEGFSDGQVVGIALAILVATIVIVAVIVVLFKKYGGFPTPSIYYRHRNFQRMDIHNTENT